jgi:hypothetical protein
VTIGFNDPDLPLPSRASGDQSSPETIHGGWAEVNTRKEG